MFDQCQLGFAPAPPATLQRISSHRRWMISRSLTSSHISDKLILHPHLFDISPQIIYWCKCMFVRFREVIFKPIRHPFSLSPRCYSCSNDAWKCLTHSPWHCVIVCVHVCNIQDGERGRERVWDEANDPKGERRSDTEMAWVTQWRRERERDDDDDVCCKYRLWGCTGRSESPASAQKVS